MHAELDIVHVVIWTMRVLFPILILIYLLQPVLLKSIYLKLGNVCGRNTQPTSASEHVDHRQIKTIEQNRPTFKIRECFESEIPADGYAPFIIRSQYSREMILVAGTFVMQQPGYISIFTNHQKLREVDNTSTDRRSTSITERDYLQSLLQFRAIKSSSLNHATWEAWNEEAQKILKGVILFKCKGVSLEVYDTIIGAGVLPDEETFTLLIRSSLVCDDVASGKLFLDEMMRAGYLPSQEIVGLVSKHLKSPHSGLNKNAPIFVPHSTDIVDVNGWEEVMPSHKRFTRVRE